MGFNGGSVDPCLYMEKSEQGVVYIGGNPMAGNPEAFDDVIEAFQKNCLVLKVIKGLKDHVSYKVMFSSGKKGLG